MSRGDHQPLPPGARREGRYNKAMLDFAHSRQAAVSVFYHNPDAEPDNSTETPPVDAVPETLALYHREQTQDFESAREHKPRSDL